MHRQSAGPVLCVLELVFSAHEVHDCEPGVSLYVPAAQGAQLVASVPVNPASQMQSAAVELAVAKDVDPAAHCWHDPAPSYSLYLPATHAVHWLLAISEVVHVPPLHTVLASHPAYPLPHTQSYLLVVARFSVVENGLRQPRQSSAPP